MLSVQCSQPIKTSHSLDFGDVICTYIGQHQYSFCFQSRLLETISTTRGFGDFDLKASYTGIPIKPFLTPEPEVSGKVLLLYSFHFIHIDCNLAISKTESLATILCRALSYFGLLQKLLYICHISSFRQVSGGNVQRKCY